MNLLRDIPLTEGSELNRGKDFLRAAICNRAIATGRRSRPFRVVLRRGEDACWHHEIGSKAIRAQPFPVSSVVCHTDLAPVAYIYIGL